MKYIIFTLKKQIHWKFDVLHRRRWSKNKLFRDFRCVLTFIQIYYIIYNIYKRLFILDFSKIRNDARNALSETTSSQEPS